MVFTWDECELHFRHVELLGLATLKRHVISPFWKASLRRRTESRCLAQLKAHHHKLILLFLSVHPSKSFCLEQQDHMQAGCRLITRPHTTKQQTALVRHETLDSSSNHSQHLALCTAQDHHDFTN
jgi:hypothetical protein